MSAEQTITDTLAAQVPGLVAVYLFGSRARGDEHAGSDHDVAFLSQSPTDPEQRFEVQEAIARQLGRDVDLVDLRAASTVLRMQVVTTGRVLFDGEPSRREAFEDLCFVTYARLNEERRGILADVAARGSVHG